VHKWRDPLRVVDLLPVPDIVSLRHYTISGERVLLFRAIVKQSICQASTSNTSNPPAHVIAPRGAKLPLSRAPVARLAVLR